MSVISVPAKDMEDILIGYIRGAESDELARIAGAVFGGECWYWGGKNEEIHFEPNENYTGNLNNFEEL